MPIAKVHRISAAAPDDVSGIEAAIAAGRIDPAGIRAVFGKTEGNGCVNDFSRGFAVQSLQLMLRRHVGEGAGSACLVMSGGTEGAMAPHWLVFERGEGDGSAGPALAIGSAHTADILPEQIGRLSQVDVVAAGVRSAMRDAQICHPADVHFVQVKCPLLTLARVAEAQARAAHTATRDTLKSMGLSRAASALGIAVALGEIDQDRIAEGAIGADASLWSARASASAGIELMGHEIVSCSACRTRGRDRWRSTMRSCPTALISSRCVPCWRGSGSRRRAS
jgi:cyanuric acid amidohydrolase